MFVEQKTNLLGFIPQRMWVGRGWEAGHFALSRYRVVFLAELRLDLYIVMKI